MARSVTDATFGWGINGLVRNVTGTIESQSETRKGLPSYIKVVGSNKLWSGEISGDVTNSTSISLVHDDKVACDVQADGISVDGYLTSFNCSGSSNSIVEFRASVEGSSSGSASESDPGDPVFLEECTISGSGASSDEIIDFSLDCSWDLEHEYSSGVPSSTSFKSFDGTFVYTTSTEGSDEITESGGTATFSLSAGGLSISGEGKITKCEQTAEVDGIVKFQKTLTITSLT